MLADSGYCWPTKDQIYLARSRVLSFFFVSLEPTPPGQCREAIYAYIFSFIRYGARQSHRCRVGVKFIWKEDEAHPPKDYPIVPEEKIFIEVPQDT